MADLAKVKRNIKRMIDGGATEAEIEAYVSFAGTSANELRGGGAPSVRMGLGDAFIGAAQLLSNAGYAPAYQPSIGSKKSQELSPQINEAVSDGLADTANRYIAEREANYEEMRGPDAGFDWGRLVGNMLALAPTAAIPGSSALAVGAMGAGSAAVMPVASNDGDYWQQKGVQTALGALMGYGTGKVMQGIGRALNPTPRPDVAYLAERGVQMRPDQLVGGRTNQFAEKMTSSFVLGDSISESQRRAVESFNRAAYNQALKPIGEEAGEAVGREGVKNTRRLINNAFNRALEKMNFVADDAFTAEITNLKSLAQNMPDDMVKVFNREIGDNLDSFLKPTGTMDGKSIQIVERSLNNLATRYAKSPDPAQSSLLGSAFKEAYSIFDRALERLNPQGKAEYQAAKQAWGQFSAIRKAANMAGSKDGVFTPNALRSAVLAGDRSVGRGAFSEGAAGGMQTLAETGQRVIGTQYPDSGTAGRAVANFVGYGGLGVVNPYAAAAGVAAMGPYTSAGQRAANYLAAGTRGPVSRQTGLILDRLALPSGILGATAISQANR